MGKVLEGVRIIELGPLMALPLCGRILGSLGAEIIKVETNRYVDVFNFAPAWGSGMGRPDLECFKRKITLDLSKPKAGPIFEKLVGTSDVLMTNFRREVLNDWGIDFPRLKEANPEIIIMWQTSAGSVGPYSQYKLYGPLTQHMCGMSLMTGFPDEALARSNTAYADYHVGVFQPLAVISALIKRRQGKGPSTMECPILSSGVLPLGPALLDFQANDRLPKRMGNRDPLASPHGVYPCRGEDSWCAIAVLNQKQWHAFCQAIGRPSWTQDPRFTTPMGRIENAAALDELVGDWTINHTRHEVMDILQEAGVPAGIVSKGEDLAQDAHLKEREAFQESVYYVPEFGKPGSQWQEGDQPTLTLETPMRFSEAEHDFQPLRRIGQDNEYVYCDLLGMSRDEITHLSDEGVLA